MLESLGYKVISTSKPAQALQIMAERKDSISLILTDVIMPEMNGPEMIEKMQETIPNLKYLYMSGYTANLLMGSDARRRATEFIPKPFSRNLLAKKVRDCLDKTSDNSQVS